MYEFEKYFATSEEIKKHNEEVAMVWKAYSEDKPIRVPAGGGIDPYRLIALDDRYSYKDYHLNPETMMEVQAQCAELNSRIIMGDNIVASPEEWPLNLDYWPFSDEAYWGCEIEFADRLQPKVYHLFEDEKVDPETIPIPDPFHDNFMSVITNTFHRMRELAASRTFHGKSYSDQIAAGGMTTTYGIFSTALQLRGINLFLDMYEDPEYVKKLLSKVAEGYAARSKAWSKYVPGKPWQAIVYDHGIDMISMKHYVEFLVPVYKRIKQMLGSSQYDASIDHCGHGEEVIRYKHKHFGVNSFTNLNASFINIERLRRDLGDEVYMHIEIHPEIVLNGPVDRIYQTVRETLTPAVKGKGRLSFGHAGNWTAPMEHLQAFYNAVKEYGHY